MGYSANYPGLLPANRSFTAGHREKRFVKKVGVLFQENVPAPKTRRFRKKNFQQPSLN
jgi:hypothetical protein